MPQLNKFCCQVGNVIKENNDIDIVCAGLPRSGSTMLYRALAGLPPGSTSPKPQTGPVRKTHSFRPQDFAGVRAAVFIFGDPVAAVISTRAHRWNKEHFRNCGAEHRDPETTDIFREDALHYERLFNAWMRPQNFALACVRYEALHKNVDHLASFLGMPVNLPPWRSRRDSSSVLGSGDLEAIQKTYARFIRRVARAPDIAFWTPRTDMSAYTDKL